MSFPKDIAMNKIIQVKFTVKEGENGKSFLYSEPLNLSTEPAVSLFFTQDTGIEQAQKIARVLNANLLGITVG
jgi:hypothetical protein